MSTRVLGTPNLSSTKQVPDEYDLLLDGDLQVMIRGHDEEVKQ
jgi:hypothetical protein